MKLFDSMRLAEELWEVSSQSEDPSRACPTEALAILLGLLQERGEDSSQLLEFLIPMGWESKALIEAMSASTASYIRNKATVISSELKKIGMAEGTPNWPLVALSLRMLVDRWTHDATRQKGWLSSIFKVLGASDESELQGRRLFEEHFGKTWLEKCRENELA